MAELSDVAQINPRRKVKKGEPVPFLDMAALPLRGRDICEADIQVRLAKGAGAHFQNGDTLVARITPCLENGKTAQVRNLSQEAVGEGSTEFIVLCGRDAFDDDFVHYVCRSEEFRDFAIARMEGTSGRQRVAWQSIAKYKFLLPAPDVRRGAATLMTKLDDRIDLLRQTNTTLEAIARALFKSWFVDFDPVRAKAEGREPEGMDTATAALFPSEFEESELGLIPKGWGRVPSGDLYDVGIGKTPPRKESHWFSDNPADVAWASIRDMGIAGAFLTSTSEFLTTEAVERFNVRKVPEGTVIMSFKLTVGRVAIADFEMTTNEAIANFKTKNGSLPQCFLYCFLKSFDMNSLSSTSSIANATNSKGVREILVMHPGMELAQRFGAIAEQIFQRIRNQQRQAATLSQLRDTLLPRLISGKLRLPDAVAITEEAIA